MAFRPLSTRDADAVRILHVSDPHYDFHPVEIREAVLSSIERADFDVVACTGDIANSENNCAEFLGWFSDVKAPKFLTPGNHDLWWIRKPATAERHAGERNADGFWGHAARAGWLTPNPDKLWDVVQNVLMFNVFYTPNPAWDHIPPSRYSRGRGGNDPMYSADCRQMFGFRDLFKDPGSPGKESLPSVAWSMGHLSPSDMIPSFFPPQVCFVNNRIGELAKAHGSLLHLFGHTHEARDVEVGRLRCVNHSWVDAQYDVNLPREGLVVRSAVRRLDS
ncbi:MAG: metallophosphoesterase [bacterium]